jgi:hypothetical protein
MEALLVTTRLALVPIIACGRMKKLRALHTYLNF